MSIIKNEYNKICFRNREEELYSILLMEINFLNNCFYSSKDEIEREAIKFGLKKLENLHKILLNSDYSWGQDDYNNFLTFIYETMRLITNQLS